jgi:hypothetical protein
MRIPCLAVICVLAAGHAQAQSALPNSHMTPGSLNPAVTQGNINQTVCRPGWTKTIRPSSDWTSRIKRQQLKALGWPDQNPRHYEEDHRVPLSAGGAPKDARNLFPEPKFRVDGWTAADKDNLEKKLLDLLCSRRITLVEDRAAFLGDWTDAYKRYVH